MGFHESSDIAQVTTFPAITSSLLQELVMSVVKSLEGSRKSDDMTYDHTDHTYAVTCVVGLRTFCSSMTCAA